MKSEERREKDSLREQYRLASGPPLALSSGAPLLSTAALPPWRGELCLDLSLSLSATQKTTSRLRLLQTDGWPSLRAATKLPSEREAKPRSPTATKGCLPDQRLCLNFKLQTPNFARLCLAYSSLAESAFCAKKWQPALRKRSMFSRKASTVVTKYSAKHSMQRYFSTPRLTIFLFRPISSEVISFPHL